MPNPREYCGIAGDDCLNPPGYRVGNASGGSPNPPYILWHCPMCGTAACRHCRRQVNGQMLCLHCA